MEKVTPRSVSVFDGVVWLRLARQGNFLLITCVCCPPSLSHHLPHSLAPGGRPGVLTVLEAGHQRQNVRVGVLWILWAVEGSGSQSPSRGRESVSSRLPQKEEMYCVQMEVP